MEAASQKHRTLSRGAVVRLGILAALILTYLLLQPWYHSYVGEQNRKICSHIREMNRWTIVSQLNKWQDEGHAFTEEELLSLAEESFQENAQTPLQIDRVDDHLEIRGLCRAGGVITVKVTDVSLGEISASCSAEGHGEWEIGFQN